MSLESFKSFVREKPNLVKFINNKEMTWQQFYEMYELYGENHSIWNKYLGITNTSSVSFKDMLGMFRNINPDELQKGIGSLQKGIGYLQGLVTEKATSATRKSTYEPRPMYKYFDD